VSLNINSAIYSELQSPTKDGYTQEFVAFTLS